MFDVFPCYNWADALYMEKRRLGITVFKDDADVPVGDTLAPHLQDALLRSRMLIPLIGPKFHESATCRFELLTTLNHAYRLGNGTRGGSCR
ncbi:toll/interleukin-1 receptor domain-containing protein [Amycolatopsis sp. NPDC003865]